MVSKPCCNYKQTSLQICTVGNWSPLSLTHSQDQEEEGKRPKRSRKRVNYAELNDICLPPEVLCKRSRREEYVHKDFAPRVRTNSRRYRGPPELETVQEEEGEGDRNDDNKRPILQESVPHNNVLQPLYGGDSVIRRSSSPTAFNPMLQSDEGLLQSEFPGQTSSSSSSRNSSPIDVLTAVGVAEVGVAGAVQKQYQDHNNDDDGDGSFEGSNGGEIHSRGGVSSVQGRTNNNEQGLTHDVQGRTKASNEQGLTHDRELPYHGHLESRPPCPDSSDLPRSAVPCQREPSNHGGRLESWSCPSSVPKSAVPSQSAEETSTWDSTRESHLL